MRNRLKTLYRICLAGVLVFGSVSAFASDQKRKTEPPVPEKTAARDAALDDLTFTEMVNSVPLDEKSAALIRKFQDKEGRARLHGKEYNSKNGCMVETFRNKEVLLITIPASKLFSPNEVEVRKDASSILAPLKRYLKDPEMYRVLLVMHTDNTGSEKYREHITLERSTALFDWFVKEGCDTRYLFSYAMSDADKLVENNSMANREKNRRLEVYLIPGKKMLEQAKKGRIVF